MNEKKRASIEALFKEVNESQESVCSGVFYIKNRKTTEQCKHCALCGKHKYYKYKDDNTPEVKYAYVDSFRKCQLYKIDIIDGSYVARLAIYQIFHFNDCAINIVKEIDDVIPKDDKQAMKIYAGAKRKIQAYNKLIYGVIGDNKIWDFADFNLEMDNNTGPILEKLKTRLTESLESEGYGEQSKYLALCEISRFLVEYSGLFIEKRIEECRKFRVNALHLRQYKLDDLMRNTTGLSEWANRKMRPFDFTKNGVLEAFHEFDRFMLNHKKINEILRNTITKIE